MQKLSSALDKKKSLKKHDCVDCITENYINFIQKLKEINRYAS